MKLIAGYNYVASYLVSKHALNLMRENELNSGGCRGCIINVVQMQNKYDENYLKQQEEIEKNLGETMESVDEKVMQLATDLVAARIRSNTIIVMENQEIERFSSLVHAVIEDQKIAGQIINMQDEFEAHVPTFKEIFDRYHTPPPRERKILEETKQLKSLTEQKIQEIKEKREQKKALKLPKPS